MRRRTEQHLDAHCDGAGSARERERMKALLAARPDWAARVRTTDELGRAVRRSWNDGPRAPSPEYLIAALRPELARVDGELGRAGRLAGLVERLAGELRALLPSPALGAGAAAALLLLFTFPLPVEPPTGSFPVSTLSNFTLPETATIYDLAQDEQPLMILQDEDGAAVIWILEQPDQVSRSAAADGWA